MTRKAVLDKDGVIKNLIRCDDTFDEEKYKLATKANAIMDADDNWNIGGKVSKGKYTPPEEPELPLKERRKDAYKEAEQAGELPESALDNVDELWKALEEIVATGKLTPRAKEIINARKRIKQEVSE